MRSISIMACALAIAGIAAADTPTMSSTSAKQKCCLSDKGPEPVPYTGKWLEGLFTRDECVAKKYGYWNGDEPNVAKKVCAKRPPDWPPNPPVDPVPPPPDDHRDDGTGGKKPGR